MADPNDNTIAAAPGTLVVQTKPQTPFAVPPQKDSGGVAAVVTPAPNFFLGGPAPDYAIFAEGSFPPPHIIHDHGFLDSLDGKHNLDVTKRRVPTNGDR